MMKAVKRILHEMITEENGLSWLAVLAILAVLGAGYLTVRGVSTGLYELVTSGGQRQIAISRGLEDKWENVWKDYANGTLKQFQAAGKTTLSAETSTSPSKYLDVPATWSQELVERLERMAQRGFENLGCDIELNMKRKTHDWDWKYSIPEFAETKLTAEKFSATWDNRELGSIGEMDIEFDSKGNINYLSFDRTTYSISKYDPPLRMTWNVSKIPQIKPFQWKLNGAKLHDLIVMEREQTFGDKYPGVLETPMNEYKAPDFWCDENSYISITIYPRDPK